MYIVADKLGIDITVQCRPYSSRRPVTAACHCIVEMSCMAHPHGYCLRCLVIIRRGMPHGNYYALFPAAFHKVGAIRKLLRSNGYNPDYIRIFFNQGKISFSYIRGLLCALPCLADKRPLHVCAQNHGTMIFPHGPPDSIQCPVNSWHIVGHGGGQKSCNPHRSLSLSHNFQSLGIFIHGVTAHASMNMNIYKTR